MNQKNGLVVSGLLFPLLGALVACGAADGSTADGAESVYPYALDGAMVCGDSRNGRPLEIYYFDEMNRELEATPVLAEMAASENLWSVSSCDEARHFGDVLHAYSQLEDQLPLEEMVEPPVDKIADGVSSTAPYAVFLNTPIASCSGILISKHWLLTAAHCFSSDGWQTVGVSRSGSSLFSGTAWVVRHPGWSGSVGDGDDLALVWTETRGAGSGSPAANSSTSYRRIFGRAIGNGATVQIHGYGSNKHDGSGTGTLRMSARTITVDSSSSSFLGVTTVTDEGRACTGDSGGPMVDSIELSDGNYADMVVGVFSYYLQDGSRACPLPGDKFYYVQAGGGASKVCSTGETGTTHSCWIRQTINDDPDTTEECIRFNVIPSNGGAAYSYLKCF